LEERKNNIVSGTHVGDRGVRRTDDRLDSEAVLRADDRVLGNEDIRDCLRAEESENVHREMG
jgi:hypothetical protein